MAGADVTMGIDLAADPKRTAMARLSWHEGVAELTTLELVCSDYLVLRWMNDADAIVGIDCPFGWPTAFVDLVSGRAQVADIGDLPEGWRREYVLRATDRWVHEKIGLRPLSVSTDKIGAVAIRLAGLLTGLDSHVHAPRDGSGSLAEVYPAAALRVWGLPHRGYKSAPDVATRQRNAVIRERLVDALLAAAPWLLLGPYEAEVRRSDDALDAVICALVARAVRIGATHPVEDRESALAEGWIHVPSRPLADLRPR